MSGGFIGSYIAVVRIAAVLILFFTTACSPHEDRRYTRIVTDMAGRTMGVPDTIKRVYVNRPGALMLYALAPELLVNRSFRMTDSGRRFMKESWLTLPYVDGSAEEIIRLKPDVIISCFTIDAKSMADARRLEEKTGIPVFQVPLDMSRYEKTFMVLGTLLDRKEQAERMTGFLHAYHDELLSKAREIPPSRKVRVYYAEGDRGLQTDPSGSFHSEILERVGARNVAEVPITGGKGMSSVSMEQILFWDPDVILVWTGMGPSLTTLLEIESDSLWAKARAVRQKRLFQIPLQPFGWFDRPPGTNRILGAIWTAQLLYPDLYRFDITRITREYFRIFYHHELTESELREVLDPHAEPLPEKGARTNKSKGL